MQLINFLEKDSNLTEFVEKVQKVKNSLLTGAGSGAFCAFIKYLTEEISAPLLLIEENEHKMQTRFEQLQGVLDDDKLQIFSLDATIATQSAVSSPDELSSRIQSLDFLLSGSNGVVLATPQALQYELSSADLFLNAKKEFSVGNEYDLNDLTSWLNRVGYKKENLVARSGEFALRGDILDIYPLDREEPIRIEFFGDEIDTIKSFDLSTQRSQDSLGKITIPAAIDRIFTAEDIQNAAKKLQTSMEDSDLELDPSFDLALEAFQSGNLPENYSFFVDYLLSNPTSILDYLPNKGLLLLDDWSLIQENVKEVDASNNDFIKNEVENGKMLPEQKMSQNLSENLKGDKHHRIYFSLFTRSMGRIRLGQHLAWEVREAEEFFGQMPLIKDELASYSQKNQTVILQADSVKRAQQISISMNDFDMHFPICKGDDLLEGRTQIIVGNYSNGFVLPDSKLVYLTERELFNRNTKPRKQIKTLENAQRLRSYAELKPGDYVVHINHGIGRFEGIQTLETDGHKRDYITITYQKGDQLFVPADQLGLVQKYVASEGKTPHINKLGGSEWAKTKRKVQSKVEDIADDLITLYAKRESEKGFAFSPDNEYQKQFEDAFPYPETPDQLRTLKEIKSDMEKPKPMDRLVVGDVGFGKTEVALRAAFKAIQDGKQVAFLAPTTILAQQHYETIKDRFKDFPVTTAVLSRFQTPKETKQILKDLESGMLDFVVGTHRILSNDVKFKDLGLLIIDEEQRFGVKHKEKLKKLKSNIDVLTLTATPIPRTLHMSMVGIRDLSVIETPPRNRYPVQTYVLEQIPSIVKEACQREMQRGGQIFYLHNRVNDIEDKVSELENLIPNARIAYAHGKMSEGQLEDVLQRFLNREFDILVTTTIIETGIDMPNVNTMIIENADHYGLSQLYQLRGRIGRSARIAYAYFLYQQNKVLTEVGEKRLDAIRDFTELGSGFKIAMRDLSIRGAGNMLGAQQHGFIDSVGYDLYSQMLADAIKERKGQKKVVRSNSEVDLGLEAYIPSEYINDQEQKIEFYKKIKEIQSDKDRQDIEDELIDRFGDYPASVENLLNTSSLKADCDNAQILTMIKVKDNIKVIFNDAASRILEGPNVFKALEHVSFRARISLNPEKHLVVLLKLPEKINNRQLFDELITFVQAAGEFVQR